MKIIKFWLLDINYDLVGNIPEIRLWGIDNEGKRIVVIDRNFRPYFYILPKNRVILDKLFNQVKNVLSKYGLENIEVVERRYFGKPVKVIRVTLQNPRKVPNARMEVSKINGVEEVLEADIRFYMRYMIDNNIYPSSWHIAEVEEIDNTHKWRVDKVYLAKRAPKFIESNIVPPIKIYAFDIECYNPYGEPNPKRDPILIIAVKKERNNTELFLAEDKDDKKVLKRFMEDIRNFDPDIIVGYNSNRFDWPYLLERTRVNRTRLNISRAGGEPAQSVYGHYSIVGRANVDLYDFAEEIMEVKVKTLENVADYLGVKKKNERVLIEGYRIHEYWDDKKKRELLLNYAKDDVESTYGLAEKFIPFAIQLSSIVGVPLDQVGAASVGYRVEWHLMRQAYKYHELIPNRVERPYETYRGAIVLKPKQGIHHNIAVLDFSSMYPNIMITRNISPDTLVPPNEPVREEDVWIAPEVGHKFRKKPAGFYRRVLERLLEARKVIREKIRELDPSCAEYRILDERQKAIKVIANATYGYCGWIGARWYKREVAEATTAWGRMIIKDTIRYAQKIGLDVIYGDTDSVFVNYDKEKINRLVEYVKKRHGLEIKVDKIYRSVFFTEAKKRYCGLLIDGRVDVVGLEAVRGDWAEIAKEVQEQVIEIVLKEEDPWKAVEYVREVLKKLKEKEIDLYKLIIWKTLSKDIRSYEVEAPHVVAARMLIEAGYHVPKGGKVGYIVCKDGESEKISSRVKPYIFVKNLEEVDFDYYTKKQIVPAALRVLSYFGIKEEHILSDRKQLTLADFF